MNSAMKIKGILTFIALLLIISGCTQTGGKEAAVEIRENDRPETPEELYESALNEDILIVYSVSTRITKTKEEFEKNYPGLCVEIRDLRSPDLVKAISQAHENGRDICDVVICNDNSGDFKRELVDTGIVVPFLPADIASHMKGQNEDGIVSFLFEAEMLFYNSVLFDAPPVKNLWELTEDEYKGRIYMPSPLRSFSTYVFCGSLFQHEEELKKAYADCFGNEPPVSGRKSLAEYFWRKLSKNVVFTNSSDEVAENLKNGNASLGIMISSKMRYSELGYAFKPVYSLEPFCGCRTSSAVMMSSKSKNANSAKLFIRFLLGEADGTGEGYKPFCTEGTWSAREDVPDGNDVCLEDIDLMNPDADFLNKNKNRMDSFWAAVFEEDNHHLP